MLDETRVSKLARSIFTQELNGQIKMIIGGIVIYLKEEEMAAIHDWYGENCCWDREIDKENGNCCSCYKRASIDNWTKC